MATDYVDPEAPDGSPLQWTPTPPGTHYSTIDDGVRYPTSPGYADYIETSTNGVIDVFNMTTLTGAGSVTSVTIFGYCASAFLSTVGIEIFMGGAWTQKQSWTGIFDEGWRSSTFNGAWTQEDLDNLQVRITADETFGYSTAVFAMYGEITYEEAPVVAGKTQAQII